MDFPNETLLERRRRLTRERTARWRSRQRESQRIFQIGREDQPNAQAHAELNIDRHNCGHLEVKCQYCQAVHFPEEIPNSCCHKGKVKLTPRESFPLFLKNILSNPDAVDYKHFHENIRSYNSAISFASMGAKLAENVPGRGPYCFRVQGQIYHVTSHLHPLEGEQRKFAQLYVLNTTQAVEERLNMPQNENCLRHILRELDLIMHAINPFAQAFRMMFEIERQNQEESRINCLPMPNVHMVLRRDRHADLRRYNLPTANEVAMVFQNDNGEPPFERDIRIYPRNPGNNRNNFVPLNILSPNMDPMTYAIFYPRGEAGWQPNLVLDSYPGYAVRTRINVSMLQFKVAQTAIRQGTFNPILYGGPLTQQWIIDSYLQVEANNLNFIRYQQSKLRAEEYRGLMDYVAQDVADLALPAGRAVILPSSFQGSPRNMRERYNDAMTIVTKCGKPDIFCTFTCNPKWPEIVENLPPGQSSSDRPDLVARVFHLKLQALMNDITDGELFGKCIAWVYTIEFQKRGLPHAHILLILDHQFKFHDISRVDEVIVAELPVEHPRLYEIVTRSMLHGPCGTLNPNSPCMDNGSCIKDFPKKFQPVTQLNVDGYPLYRRREGNSVIVDNRPVDNRWVVPFNPILLLKYDAHINVEACTTIKSVKYVYKYIYKGYDSANVIIRESNNQQEYLYDEISNHVNARYVSAPEAMWRLLEFKMHDKSHSVIRLAIHLPLQQTIYFQAGAENSALNRAQTQHTTLTAWFNLNSENVNARQYLYSEIPVHYKFEKGIWKERQRRKSKVIARMYCVSPRDTERYCLRLLLLKIPGATSYEYLRTVDGVVLPTFLEAARQRQLLADDQEWDRCLAEASAFQMPSQMRQIFAFICLFGNPSDAVELWEKFKDFLSEDFRRNSDDLTAQKHALCNIEAMLKIHGSGLAKFGFSHPGELNYHQDQDYDQVTEASDAIAMLATLNLQQQDAFNKIREAIENDQVTPRCFYLDGPGGSGKTYLYNTLMAFVRGRAEKVLAYATTGIAAILLKGGRTVHSGFKLPVPILETSTSSIRVASPEATLLRQAKLIIIDECTMMTAHALRCIDILLREVMASDEPFGNKVLLLGGDFRQTLPVVMRGTRTQIIEACIKSSPLWRHFIQLKLIQNMRSGGQVEFNHWLLQIGEGNIPAIQNLPCDMIQIPPQILCTSSIVTAIYGNHINLNFIQEISKKIILTSTNKDASQINNEILNLLPGISTQYFSSDSVEKDSLDDTYYSEEFLHEQTPSGMPPHQLLLKVGAIVMLIRNLNPKKGLCNGTRLIIRNLHRHFIDAEVLTGTNKTDRVFLPRMDLAPSETNLPFKLKRRQFPIIMAFAITINKAQGQTFDSVGLYLEKPVFSHGQLYVALSRCKNANNIKVSILDTNMQGNLLSDNRIFTKNIVYPEIL